MNNMKTVFLLVLLTVTLVIVGELVGGIQGMMFFFILALMFNVGSYWFSDKIVLRMYRARPAPDNSRLTETVRRVSQMAISRSREFAADQIGAGYVHNPDGLASALQKLHISSQKIGLDANPATAHMFIVNPLSARRMTKLFSTHPPLEERIARLKTMTRGVVN